MSLPIPPRADLKPGSPSPPGRPIATWTVLHSLGIFLLGNVVIGQLLIGSIVLFFFGAVVAPSGGATTPVLVASLFADVAMVGTILGWLMLRREPVVALLGVPSRGRWLREIGVGVGVGVLLYIVVGFAGGGSVLWFLQRAFHERIVIPSQLSTGLSPSAKVLAAILAIAIAPPAEELFFRGVLFKGLRDRRGFALAAGVSAVVFGLAHWTGEWRGALVLVISMTVTGLGLALLYERRENLVTNIAAHCTFNIVGIVLLFWLPKAGG